MRTIAAITFTEAAATELRDRIRTELERAASVDPSPVLTSAIAELDEAAISTLHAFAQRILSEHALEAGLPPAVLAPEPTSRRRLVRFRDDQAVAVDDEVITEIRFSIFVGEREVVTLMCSPWKLRELVLGFLYIEGLLDGPDDVELLRVCLEDRLAEVVLRSGPIEVPERKILTSGCTGGATFGKYLAEIERFRVGPGPTVTPGTIYGLMRKLYGAAELYKRSGGVHTSILAEGDELLIVAEDIGRHNTLDKIAGEALLRGIPTAGRMILTSGRISSEMLLKSAIMGVPLVASRTSPTELAVTLGERLNITVIGYVRPGSLNVYSHPWRVSASRLLSNGAKPVGEASETGPNVGPRA
jgi:FdhD protein